MSNTAERYHIFFKETYATFKKIASYAIIIEKYGKGNKILVASINELRSVLFHLYNLLGDIDEAELTAEYIEAKEHLHRTYLDLFTKSYGVLTELIHEYQDKYSVEVMTVVCPLYYGEMFPVISKMKRTIAERRAERKRNISKEAFDYENVEANHKIIIQLLDWVDLLEDSKLSFNLRKQENKRSNWNISKISYGSAIVGGIIGAIVATIFLIILKSI